MKNKAGRILAVLLSAAMLAATAIPAASAEETNEPVFKTAGSDSIYEGLPLFDGDPDHLDAYLDTLFEYVGEEGMMRYSLGYRGDYQLRYGENAGKLSPAQSCSETMCRVFRLTSRQFWDSVTPGMKIWWKKSAA